MTAGVTMLDAPALLERAQRETGLADYGDDTLPARLSLVVEEIRRSAIGDPGEREAAKVIHWLLTSRLQLFADRERHPIAAEEIVRPIFATGEPRSGTTLLHALLSVDPNGRALRFWEVMYPSPPPGLAAADDARRDRSDADWRDILRAIPRWLAAHPYNDMLGQGLPECERTWAFDFRMMTPSAWWRVPMRMNTTLPADPRAQYRLHKMMLQQCQYARSVKYWVLKGFHGRRLAALFEVYPDARMIWVHRDPVQAIASQIVLFGQINESLAGGLDWRAFAAAQVAACRENFRAYLREPLLDDPRIHHVRYPDFVRDPVGTIRAFYERFGVPFTEDAEQAMRSYLADNRGDRYGKFVYSLDVIGEDIESLHRELAPYRERFGLEIETRR
jgi:sulfotransferase family protein